MHADYPDQRNYYHHYHYQYQYYYYVLFVIGHVSVLQVTAPSGVTRWCKMKPLHMYTFVGALMSATLFFFLYTVPFLRHFQDAHSLLERRSGLVVTSHRGQVVTDVHSASSHQVIVNTESTHAIATKSLLDIRGAHRSEERSVTSKSIGNTGNAFATKRIGAGATRDMTSWPLQPRVACDARTMLVFLVCSAVHRFELRAAIRATWGGAAHSVRLFFVLGQPEARYRHLEGAIVNESRVHGDVLQSNIVDSYANLSLKTRAALAWTVTSCSATYFVAKTDDDVYVNVRDLLQELARMMRAGARRFMMGRLIRDAKPDTDRKSKWYTPRAIYANRTYPPYLSGSAYVISTDLVNALLGAATRRKLFWLEDIYITGLLSRDVGAQLIDNARFAYTKVPLSDPCHYTSLFAAHELTPTELRTVWAQIHRPDSNCAGSSKEHFRASHSFR